MPKRKEIIYPIFLECCQYTNDTYWENIFEDLAYGKTPYGTYIYKDSLCCSYKNKEFSYNIERKDAEIVHDEVYRLLTEKLGIMSNREKVARRKAFNQAEANLRDARQEWSAVRKKKNVKKLLIELYVTQMKNKFALTIKQAKYLLSVIMIALTLKVITAEDIQYENGKIIDIDGIDFERKQILVKRNLYHVEGKISSSDIGFTPKRMDETWEKYLENLRKIAIE